MVLHHIKEHLNANFSVIKKEDHVTLSSDYDCGVTEIKFGIIQMALLAFWLATLANQKHLLFIGHTLK